MRKLIFFLVVLFRPAKNTVEFMLSFVPSQSKTFRESIWGNIHSCTTSVNQNTRSGVNNQVKYKKNVHGNTSIVEKKNRYVYRRLRPNHIKRRSLVFYDDRKTRSGRINDIGMEIVYTISITNLSIIKSRSNEKPLKYCEITTDTLSIGIHSIRDSIQLVCKK